MKKGLAVPTIVIVVIIALILIFTYTYFQTAPSEFPWAITSGIKVLKPHFGSINCEEVGTPSGFTTDTFGGFVQFPCTGRWCELGSIEPLDEVYKYCDWLSCTDYHIEYLEPSQCYFDGYNVGSGSTFTSLPYTFYTDQTIQIDNVGCRANIYTIDIFGNKVYFPGIPDGSCSNYYCDVYKYSIYGTYQPIMLVKYFDSAHIQIEGTQQCTFQDVWTKIGALEGNQPRTSSWDAILKLFGVSHTSDTGNFYSNDYKPQQLEYNTGILYIQYWEEIPDYGVKTYNNKDVLCLPNDAIYELTSVTTISGNQYYIPTNFLGNAECCYDAGICTVKYGSNWFCDQTTFMCNQEAECESDLECNPTGKKGCVFENGNWYMYDASCEDNKCVGVEHELVGLGKTYECCRYPSDTCPRNTDPPQYCGEDFKCHEQTDPLSPCLKECCIGEVGVQEKTCQEAGYSDEYICCRGVCMTPKDCAGVCNYDGECQEWESEQCPDCQIVPPLPTPENCYDACDIAAPVCDLLDFGCKFSNSILIPICKFQCWIIDKFINIIMGFISASIVVYLLRKIRILKAIPIPTWILILVIWLVVFFLSFISVWIGLILIVMGIILMYFKVV